MRKKLHESGSLLAVDPGIEFGIAYWAPSRACSNVPMPPTCARVLSPKAMPWFERVSASVQLFEDMLDKFTPTIVVIEWPNFTGLVASKKGDLGKLQFIIGAFAQCAHTRGCSVHLAPVTVWKGQLSKETVNRRVVAVLGDPACRTFNSHAWDAVGIGMWFKGWLVMDSKKENRAIQIF